MTQIELESRLAQMEADYSKRITEANSEIMNHKIHIEQLNAEHNMAVSKHKQQILNFEGIIATLKSARNTEKAKLFKEYEESQQTPATL